MHCTLPTRVRAPTGKGTHLDGPFLLSVDRGSLDGTHAWNAALLQHGLGELLVKLLRWAARACRDADDKAKVLRDAFSRLPPLTRDADGKLSTTVAGATVSLHALDAALRRESLLPCLPLGTFRTAREARWVPPAFAERVPAPVLKEHEGARRSRRSQGCWATRSRTKGRGPASSRRRRRGAASDGTRGSSALPEAMRRASARRSSRPRLRRPSSTRAGRAFFRRRRRSSRRAAAASSTTTSRPCRRRFWARSRPRRRRPSTGTGRTAHSSTWRTMAPWRRPCRAAPRASSRRSARAATRS